MKKIFLFLIVLSTSLTAGIPINGDYQSPTKRLIERESWDRIRRKILDIKVPAELFPFFDEIAQQEDWGHIGYHGANQGYRVYQDVIKITLEEILGIIIRENFHFLRVPGDPDLNLNSMDEFTDFWDNKIDNKNDKRAKQLLSLNFGVYSNFDSKGSCSLYLFVKDKSKTSIDYAKQLIPFYTSLGIDPKELENIFDIGRRWLDEEGGILLQLAEFSHVADPNHEAYNFADMHGYPAKTGGLRYGSYPLSNHYDRMATDLYINQKLDIAPQLRILLNNRYTLNPFSYLVVKRWDLYPKETVEAYEEELRNYIRNLDFDREKMFLYKHLLYSEWQKCEDCLSRKED